MTSEQLHSLKPGQRIKATYSKDVFEVTRRTVDKDGVHVFVRNVTLRPEFEVIVEKNYEVIEDGSNGA
jgi:hypothetical protein